MKRISKINDNQMLRYPILRTARQYLCPELKAENNRELPGKITVPVDTMGQKSIKISHSYFTHDRLSSGYNSFSFLCLP